MSLFLLTYICCIRQPYGLQPYLNLTLHKRGLISVVVGAGAAWFGLYAGTGSRGGKTTIGK